MQVCLFFLFFIAMCDSLFFFRLCFLHRPPCSIVPPKKVVGLTGVVSSIRQRCGPQPESEPTLAQPVAPRPQSPSPPSLPPSGPALFSLSEY